MSLVCGLNGERGVPGIGAVSNAPIGCKAGELDLNQLAEAGFEVCNAFQRLFDLRLHLLAGPLVEGHDDGVFRGVVIVGSSGGYAGSCRMFRSGASVIQVLQHIRKET